jgi:hypothetical protein
MAGCRAISGGVPQCNEEKRNGERNERSGVDRRGTRTRARVRWAENKSPANSVQGNASPRCGVRHEAFALLRNLTDGVGDGIQIFYSDIMSPQ